MAQLLNQEIFKFILVFLRIGSAIMLMPGFSASYVNMRQRLSIALAVSVVLVPFLNDQLPPQPSDLPDAIKCICLKSLTAFSSDWPCRFYSPL